jgi:hypothetical protein
MHEVQAVSPLANSMSPQIESASAYLIEIAGKERHVSRHVFSSPDDLRKVLRRSWELDSGRIVVLHGLPVGFVAVLRDELGLSADLVEAIAGRRTYQTSRRQPKIEVVSFDYPELVTSTQVAAPSPEGEKKLFEGMTALDVMGDPQSCTVSANGTQALFCRATLWAGERADGKI